ncbi:TPA: hypothetical protein WIA41_001079, partial [Neisseria meningitidis]
MIVIIFINRIINQIFMDDCTGLYVPFPTFFANKRKGGLSDGGGFAFEVQLSLTEKGQYAVAYGLSCKKDCHELHATDP